MMEILMDPLAALVITFIVMSLISVVGVILLFAAKNEKFKKGMFYFLAIWGMIIAYCSVLSTPGYMAGSVLVSWVLGGLSVAALLIQLCMKNEKRFQIARVLVTISVAAGMVDCFLI